MRRMERVLDLWGGFVMSGLELVECLRWII